MYKILEFPLFQVFEFSLWTYFTWEKVVFRYFTKTIMPSKKSKKGNQPWPVLSFYIYIYLYLYMTPRDCWLWWWQIFTTFRSNVISLRFVERYSCNLIWKKSTCIFAVHVNVVLRAQTVLSNFETGHLCISKVLLFQMETL